MDWAHSLLLLSQGNLTYLWMLIPSVLVPVLLARVLFRGKWKEIAQAYGIWLALWFLFGLSIGLKSGFAAGFGWAVMLGLLSWMPIVGIPVLLLLIKLVSFFKYGQGLARSSVAEPGPIMVGDRSAAPAYAHRPLVLAHIKNRSWAVWATILGFCVFFALLKLTGAPSSNERQQLRTQFHLPDDVALSRVSEIIPNTKHCQHRSRVMLN